jgi:hypothetical protein
LRLLVSDFQWFVVCFDFGPFNGFRHYDYVCEISPKNNMFFSQYDKISPKKKGKISPKYMKNDGLKYLKKKTQNLIFKKPIITAC